MPTPSDSRADRPASGQKPLRLVVAVAVTVLAVAIVVVAGVFIDSAQRQPVPKALASCRTAAQLAPDLYRSAPPMCINVHGEYLATVDTTKGSFTIKLLPSKSPVTVNNFVVLAVNGYFTGRRFLAAPSWYVQSGDPTDTGRGGPGYTLPTAPVGKGAWASGSVGMARLSDGKISGSQFFITRTGWKGGRPKLSYNYFGTVSKGFNNLTTLGTSDRILSVTVREI
ncbi:MAG TPA: peptidylprolyl isomerase [Candidatus Dormibacteraeota bacterium]|jgi:cyclophilin family peptidyl-prolyl cis-trans isomerase|nr:peptidylprolyl isomerase [Candidatus Dormibacteraeota bacterium]